MSSAAVKSLKNEVEDYDQSVKAILAFSALVVHNGKSFRNGAQFGIGRRMSTSPNNIIVPEKDVTPDIVAQKSLEYGIVAELKKSLPQNSEYWDEYITQVAKYDGDLVGWFTSEESIPDQDTSLIIHHSRSRSFIRHLKSKLDAGELSFGKRSSVIEFISSEETARFYVFRLEYGTIQDAELMRVLVDGVSVPLDKVLRTFPSLKYYDAVPPLPRLLTDLWMDVFPARQEADMFDEKTGSFQIPVSASEISTEMQDAFGSGGLYSDARSTQFPKLRWVKSALSFLCSQGMAIRDESDSDIYTVNYRTMRGDVTQAFIDKVASAQERESETSEEQTDLFPEK